MKTALTQLSTLSSVWRHPHAAREEIVAFQNKRLRHLITHAYENVPYYRRLFDRHGLKPTDVQSVDDLSLIPITSKQDLQSLPVGEVVARGVAPEHLLDHTTSGSSGEPFTIRRTRQEHTFLLLCYLRAAMHSFGVRLRDKRARVILVRPPHPRNNQLHLRLLRSLSRLRSVQINCLLPPEDIVRTLRDFRPDVLTGFPGVIAQVSQRMNDNDRRVIRPRVVVVGGETLTPLMRTQISEALAAPVFDFYASQEFGLIAWGCKETGEYHTCDDGMIVEVLKDGCPAAADARGEVVGTNLYAFTMPFIRYRLGDLVTKGSETCRCGQPFSTIQTIQGRMIDYFPLANGRMIHPYEIVLLLLHEAASWIRQYQLVQEREDQVTLRVVPSTTPSPRQVALLQESVIAVLGQGVEFQVIFVPEIEVELNGKFRISRSFVKSAYDGIDWDQVQLVTPNSPSAHGGERR